MGGGGVADAGGGGRDPAIAGRGVFLRGIGRGGYPVPSRVPLRCCGCVFTLLVLCGCLFVFWCLVLVVLNFVRWVVFGVFVFWRVLAYFGVL